MHSRIDFNVSDAILEVYGNAAEDVVLNICNTSYDAMVAEYGDVPAPIMVASLQLVELSYTQRSPVTQANLSIVPYSFDLLVKPYMKLTSGGGMQAGALYDRDEQRYKFGQTGSEIQALLNKAADLPTREELDAMLDEKQDKPKPYFLSVENASILGFFNSEKTVVVGIVDADSGVFIDETLDWGEGRKEIVLKLSASAPEYGFPWNTDGCQDSDVGTDFDIPIPQITAMMDTSVLSEDYEEEEDFRIGKVVACEFYPTTHSGYQEMACEIKYKGKTVEGWWIFIPQSTDWEEQDVLYIRNFLEI